MDHDVLLGLPLVGQADKEELRTFLVARVPYVLAEAENPSDLTALVDGSIPNVIGWNRTWFWYDPLGGITEVDNVTVIQTNDGFIYKANGIDLDIESVLDRDLTEPPATGLGVGDCYIPAAGSTGDWAGFDDYKLLYTERGWVAIAPKIGNWVLVEDEDAYVRYTAAGTWELGSGARAFDANSIPKSALINVDPLRVENQTTNTPPASPLVPVAYVIGGSPTGSWVGHAKKLAICELDGSFTIYTPATGQRIYDKALASDYKWDGSNWITASGAFRINIVRYTASTTYSKPSRLIGIIATVIGGGASSASTNGVNGAAGGPTSLGSLLSATGGAAGTTTAGGAGGTGSGGDIDETGQTGAFFPQSVADGSSSCRALPPGGGERGAGGKATGSPTAGCGGGGPGGRAREWLAASELAASETVTIGGGGGSTNTGSEAGVAGEVVIHEYIED